MLGISTWGIVGLCFVPSAAIVVVAGTVLVLDEVRKRREQRRMVGLCDLCHQAVLRREPHQAHGIGLVHDDCLRHIANGPRPPWRHGRAA